MKEWKKWPYFPMYTKDILSSQPVRQMTDRQFGWYLKLLIESWECERPCYLPRDKRLLMKLANVTQPDIDAPSEVHKWWRDKFTAEWDFVIAQFAVSGEFIYNERLLDEYSKRCEFAENNSRAGKASVESRRKVAEWLEGAPDDIDEPPKAPTVMATLEKFKEVYPKVGDGMLLEQEWCKVVKASTVTTIWTKILADIKGKLAPGGAWQEENGRFIPKAVKYVREQQWNDYKPGNKKPTSVKESIIEAQKHQLYEERNT